MMRGVFITTLVIAASGIREALRSGGGAHQRWPWFRLRGAREVRIRLHVLASEPRAGPVCLNHDAHHRRNYSYTVDVP